MEKIILIGHGSPKKDANNVDIIAGLLHNALHADCPSLCVKVAYMQFAEPTIATAIDECVAEGADRIVIHPFFLYSGMHVTKDIPAVIAEARGKHPGVEFIYTAPLGIHEGFVKIVLERINAAKFPSPGDIERRSFEIISEEADFTNVPEEQQPIVKRVIHATADFEFKKTLVFHPDAVKRGIEAIKAGKDILTDVQMVKTGISKPLLARWGGKAFCSIEQPADDGIAEKHGGGTRAEAGIEAALAGKNNIGIIAIGNAPTALLKVIEIFNRNGASDPLPLVIGVPVGFVKALESKALLSTQPFPFITNLSRKGGTPVAVAIVNALLKMAAEEK
jgi:precorrin-8X/cobalt-precorrin-8 methylmutase